MNKLITRCVQTYFFGTVLLSLSATLLLPNSVYATSTSIDVNVGSRRTDFTIVTPSIDSTTNKSIVHFSGHIRNISQIMVYVGDVYSQTISIDSGSLSYDFFVTLPEGTHTITLVGVDALNGTTIERTIQITYTSNASSEVVDAVVGTVGSTKKTVVASSEYLQGQVDQASVSQPAAIMSDVAFKVLSALDLVPLAGSPESVTKMTARFWSVTLGTTFLVLTQPMIAAYHLIRYRLMEWNVHALPDVVHAHASLILRIGGAIMVAAGFLI